ncbi:hypothetical protein [Actinophytocola algeriensis]|uniref:Uncharacterized protein n=1 Tax=Actinophytocola algeriensis TaxID=1768010 RepID=A0A7W7VGJ2_9PSEU|nr:hypothetical protein [Actinophytocola algeriensis]MBB4909224.1 hypothetical protein [Actinophytocola algeriensis]MBE1474388.1 hypothetical protein [Actinophytocola algeriensis]
MTSRWRPNPILADHEVGHPVRVAQEEFNDAYRTLLYLLEDAFTGDQAVPVRHP